MARGFSHGRSIRSLHHHHDGGGHTHIMINPYMGNPNVVTLNWNPAINGFDENDAGFMKMQMEGYDPVPAKRVIAEIHALKDQLNFKGTPEMPNICLMIICFILIIPWFCFICYLIAKQTAWMEEVNDFRLKSQAIINKHNQALSQGSRYYLEAGQFYPTWLFIHLARANQPGMPQMMHSPNMMMNNPQMMGMNQGGMVQNQNMMMM